MDCPFCSSGMQQTTERTEKAIFTWMDNNPNILRNYIFSHASQNVVDDIMLAASLKKSKSFHPSQHCFSRINSLSLSQSKHTELPIRKINSSEFEELAFHPILATGSDGYQSFLASLPLSYVTSPRPCFQDPPTESESNETFSHFNSRFGKEKREEGRQALADSFAELYSSDLMQELVLDIWNDSDLPSLCFKILRNACLLLNADRSSLFMVEVNASTGDRILVSKLFDVTAKCTLAESLKKSEAKSVSLPFGVGIVGWVAQTGKAVNISNVYE
uniref:GAF domain-containing protein n=1 Tax=Mesocestoides corti TaxID=53468 RepID=A0A5K3F8E0_MESCO